MPSIGPDNTPQGWEPHSITNKAPDTALREVTGKMTMANAPIQQPITGSFVDLGTYNKFGNDTWHLTKAISGPLLVPQMPQYSDQLQTNQAALLLPGFVQTLPTNPSALGLLIRKGYLGTGGGT
jgi:hypothetical protein